MKIVIDTNVLVSAIFFGGHPRELLEHLVFHRLDAYASNEIITEYRETVEQLSKKYSERPGIIPLTTIISAMKLIEPLLHIDVCRDPDDNKFIECAVEARCVYIVSGDKDLLSLSSYNDIEIVTVSEFLARFF